MAEEVPVRAVDSAGETGGAWTRITTSDGTSFLLDLTSIETCGELIAGINGHPDNGGACRAGITDWSLGDLFDSQFFWHLYESTTFQGRSYATDQTILEIIGERAKFSLALTIPAMALGWMLALGLSCLVAYYRETWIDRSVVFLAVLGLCIPFLAYMLFGQMIMFSIAPKLAVGLSHPLSIYVPVLISVVAGIGVSVRFYRTVILDQVNQDYVRTARAKGVALPTILFVHVLRNSMLPILTNLISSIPFLIMGSLLLESFFGIPGLGDLMITSISSRDVPIITGLTFLTAALYVISLLITDILYAVFDPRIRLR
jgi:peptide/nickel transport system permease protein